MKNGLKEEKMKKTTLTLAFLLSAALCTACSSGDSASTTAAPTTTAAATTAAVTEKAGETASSETEKQLSEAAEKYPSEKTITWYVLNPGNATDTIARILGPAIGEELGQTVVVENAPGAGGMNMLNPVLAADADGYTIASLPVAGLCLTPFSSDCPFDYTDFQMLYSVFSQPQVMVVNGDAPYSTFEEWKAYVEANPGAFRFGVPGASTVHNMCLQGLKLETGLDYNVINYSDNSETTAALMGKHIDGIVLGFSEVQSGISNGDFKILAFTTPTKYEEYADFPSLEELGYTSRGVAFQGICMKAGTDPDVVAKLTAAFDKVFSDPEVIETLSNAGMWVEGTFQEGEAFTETVKSTYEFYEKVLTDTGLMQELYQ